MTRQSYFILASRWRNVDLLWTGPNTWVEVHDRPLRQIDDAEALRMFGDEAFRRCDNLLHAGERESEPSTAASDEQTDKRVYEPQTAELVSRRVVEVLRSVGWNIEIDDSMNDYDDTFRAVKDGRVMAVRVPEDHRWSLELSNEHTSRLVESALEMERWLLETGLETGLDTEQFASLTHEIVSARPLNLPDEQLPTAQRAAKSSQERLIDRE